MSQRKDAGESVLSGQGPDELSNGTLVQRALAWIGDDGIFGNLKFHGNTKWQPFALVTLAVFWVWSDAATLLGAFRQAALWAQDILGVLPVTSYQGLTAALATWSRQLLPLLQRQRSITVMVLALANSNGCRSGSVQKAIYAISSRLLQKQNPCSMCLVQCLKRKSLETR